MRPTCFITLVLLGGCVQLPAPSETPQLTNAVSYTLPSGTWRVTLGVAPADNPDWIVANFLSGAMREGGTHTETWDGLDDNYMPVPPGDYVVQGIVMPARKWEMDGEYHSLIARYQFAAGDSWCDLGAENERDFPWILGHVFGGLRDISVAPNGKAAFWFNYIENAWNPFLADLHRPIGHDQVLQRYNSGGTGGGSAVATDGEHIWAATAVEGQGFAIFRADRQWGTGQNIWGVPGEVVPARVESMVVADRLYVTQPDGVWIFDKDKGGKLAVWPVANPQALIHRDGKLIVLHDTTVSVREGDTWKPLFTVPAGASDLEQDPAGNFYITLPAQNAVWKLDPNGRQVARLNSKFWQPARLAMFGDHVLVIESDGAGRLSEWDATGQLVREWFLAQNAALGYCLDGNHLYGATASGKLARYIVDFDKPAWRLDQVWELPNGGAQHPQIIRLGGKKFIAFPGGAHSGMKIAGDKLIPALNLDHKTFPGVNYWGERWLNDLSLAVFVQPDRFMRRWPTGDWREMFRTSPPGKGVLFGGNELPGIGVNWIHLAGDDRDGWYVAESFGPSNPGGVDTAGSYFSQVKLSRYTPAGKPVWRVGRKAFRLAEHGQMYAAHLIGEPAHGIVGIFDSNGMYHLYTTNGLFVDTLGMDAFRHGLDKTGMYAQSGESWYGRHYLHHDTGQVYLLMGRAQLTTYEVENWKPGIIEPLPIAHPHIRLAPQHIAEPHPLALPLRGGKRPIPTAEFRAALGGPPALDGSLTGWENAPAIEFGLDPQRHVTVRGMFDREHVYLHWHVRLPAPFKPATPGDLTRIFTHDRGADTVSFYFRHKTDQRIVFAITENGPVALGMYQQRTGGRPVTYTSPVRQERFDHVGVVENTRLHHQITADGFILVAALPVQITGDTIGNFEATLGGRTKFWWANVGGEDHTLTTDEPSEAALYPRSWAPLRFRF